MRKYSISRHTPLMNPMLESQYSNKSSTNSLHKSHASVPSREVLHAIDNEIADRIQGMSEMLERMGKENAGERYFKELFKGFQQNVSDLELELEKEIAANEGAQKKVDYLSAAISSLQFEISKLKSQVLSRSLAPFIVLKEACNFVLMTSNAQEFPIKAFIEVENKIRAGKLTNKEFKVIFTEYLTTLLKLGINKREGGIQLMNKISHLVEDKILATKRRILKHLANLEHQRQSFDTRVYRLVENARNCQAHFTDLSNKLLHEKTKSMKLSLEIEKLKKVEASNEQLRNRLSVFEEETRRKEEQDTMTRESFTLSENTGLRRELQQRAKEIRSMRCRMNAMKERVHSRGYYVVVGLMLAVLVMSICFQPINLNLITNKLY
eukprot:TRINITY_DN6094_c0_g2_i1.p1 TRINITY_DN6094_c0_g2~~TRINITY_DN6094_c0_g2_i1.p1  ORF type:complete len:380 (-),score=86.81 TRINITY_DN6094_c0_g2_i1:112-1251(-)